nr:unnamed protein product [Callosobruchus analis]
MEWHAEATISEGSVMYGKENSPTTSTTISSNIRKPRVPPKIITGEIGEYKTFINKRRSIIQSENFNVKFNKNNAKVSISDTEKFDVLRKELIDSKTLHHTYTKEEDKHKRIVMKAAPNMDLKTLKKIFSRRI